MKNILAENLLRFGVKNLNEHEKFLLSTSILTEQSQEANAASAALRQWFTNNPYQPSSWDIGSTYDNQPIRNRTIAQLVKDNKIGVPKFVYGMDMRGQYNKTTKIYTPTGLFVFGNIDPASLKEIETASPGFTDKIKAESPANWNNIFQYTINIDAKTTTVAGILKQLKKLLGKLDDTLITNMLVLHGVKNLNETYMSKKSVLLEQSQEAKNALAAMNDYLFKNPMSSKDYRGNISGTAEMVNKRDSEIARIKQSNPDAPIVSWYCRFRMLGNNDPKTKAFTLSKIEIEANITQATLDEYEKIAPGFIKRAEGNGLTGAGFMYRVNIPVTANDTVTTVRDNIRKKAWTGPIDNTLLTNMLTLYGVKTA